ncbi:hypothetical protein ACPPVU_12670 [Mucilaginibacter sp. McL0603]|uniref:hypothetical protein n=1 Tax=Mucilaginibacter sp. McL0603 TaxID=3415670 RepID=UPI003CF07592
MKSKSVRVTLVFFGIALISVSCHKSVKSRSDLFKFLSQPANNLEVTQQVGEIETSVYYKPWKPINKGVATHRTKNDSASLNKFKSKYFFVLSLSANHKELLRQLPFEDYSEMVQVLAFRMSDYISAVTDDGKYVLPDQCLFEQTYGMGEANHLMIIFDKSKFTNSKLITLHIKEFGLKTGNLNYKFDKQNLDDL